MKQVSREEAVATIGDLFEQVERGEEVVITRDGRAVARLLAASPPEDAAASPDDMRLLAAIRRLHAEWQQQGVKPFTAEEISDLLGRRD